ncbi:MAG: PadR family transcriptional regulator [Actinomycetota bacterium]
MDLVRGFQRGAIALHVLHHAGPQGERGGVHGAWLAAELARHGYRVSPGTLYPLLSRMQSEGLLTSRSVVVEGRRRRVYKASAKGRKALAGCRIALEELSAEVLGPS